MKKIILLVSITFGVVALGIWFFLKPSKELSLKDLHHGDDILFLNMPNVKQNWDNWSKNSAFQFALHFEGVQELRNALATYKDIDKLDDESDMAIIVKEDGSLIIALENSENQSFTWSSGVKEIKLNNQIWYFKPYGKTILASIEKDIVENFSIGDKNLKANWNHLFFSFNIGSFSKKWNLGEVQQKELSEWLETIPYSIDFQDNEIICSGFLESNNEEVKALQGQKAIGFDMKELLPVNFESLKLMQLENGDKYLDIHDITAESSHFDDLRLASVKIRLGNGKVSNILVLKSADTQGILKQELGSIINIDAGLSGYALYPLLNPDWMKNTFPSFVKNKVTYVAIFSNQAILGDGIEEIRTYIDYLTNGQTWASSIEQMKWVEKELIDFNLLEINRIDLFFRSLPNESKLKKYFLSNYKLFDSAPLLLTQKSMEENGFFSTLSLAVQSGAFTISDQVAEMESIDSLKISQTDTVVVEDSPEKILFETVNKLIWGPKAIKNYLTNDMEYLVQDETNMLYLTKKDGKIDWKVKLQSRIQSDIFEVDIFKNSKIQYLFSTSNKLYCIDRLGEFVEKFPFDLPNSKSISGLNILDYDHSKNYRIAVYSGNECYMFDTEGKLLDGWNPMKFKSELVGQLQHFRHQNKDYLVAMEKSGVIHAVQRKGESYPGFPVSQKEIPANVLASFISGKGIDDSYITFATGGMNIVKISLKGTMKTGEKLPFSRTLGKVCAYDLKGDKRFAISSDKALFVFDDEFEKMMSYNCQSMKLIDFQYYKVGGKVLYVLIFSEFAQLVNENGEIILNNIPTKNKISMTYSSVKREGTILYVSQNQLKESVFKLPK